MRNLLLLTAASLLLASCVSKKKFMQVSKLAEERAFEKAVLEDVLNKMVVQNDSLNNLVIMLDSLLTTERDNYNQLLTKNTPAPKKEERGIKIKVKPSLISEKEEYDTKAIYIYNFTSYIFWPGDLPSETFNIGIVGDSPIKGYLQARANGRDVNNAPITVETYNPKKNYHILFFSKSGEGSFNKIRKSINSKAVLFITENSILENIGSHVTLFVDGKKVRYTANKAALEKSRLKVNSTLYRLSSEEK